MTAANFDSCFAETEKWEGWHKFSNNPHDPGGATYCGLTQRAYDAWRSKNHMLIQNVRAASDTEIKQIFRDQYWNPVRGDDLWSGLDLMAFDISINSGAGRATMIIQRALGVTADGWFGLETLHAAQGTQDKAGVLGKVHEGRLAFWRSLSTFRWFGTGWTNREMDVYERAQAMLNSPGPPA